jgi:hypothetical protein
MRGPPDPEFLPTYHGPEMPTFTRNSATNSFCHHVITAKIARHFEVRQNIPFPPSRILLPRTSPIRVPLSLMSPYMNGFGFKDVRNTRITNVRSKLGQIIGRMLQLRFHKSAHGLVDARFFVIWSPAVSRRFTIQQIKQPKPASQFPLCISRLYDSRALAAASHSR